MMDKSRVEVPVLNASKEPGLTYYVMECDLTVENVEMLGDTTKERRAELHGYLSKEVLDATLDMMKEVLGE